LTAAAEGKPALEGFESHGVFTWALLDALKNGDRNAPLSRERVAQQPIALGRTQNVH